METSSEHSVDDILAALQTNAQSGLSDGDARSRLDQYGRNQLTAEKPLSRWRKFLAQFTDILVILLLVATRDLGRAVALSARIAVALRSDGDLRRRAAQRDHGLHAGIAGGVGGRRAAADVGGARARDSRWRATDAFRRRRSCPATSSSSKKATPFPADARLIRVHRAANGGSGADGREPAGVERHRFRLHGRSRARRPPQHDFQRHGGDLRPRARGGHRDRHADRDGPHRRHAERSAAGDDAAAEGARSRRQAARRRRRRHRGRDDRDDHPRRTRARLLGAFRRAHSRRGARGGGGAGRLAGGRDGGALPRRAADGAAERHRAPLPRSRRSARRTSSPPTRPAR